MTLDITADEYYGADRAGQARPGALPMKGHAGGHRPRPQPVRPGARLLRRAPQRISARTARPASGPVSARASEETPHEASLYLGAAGAAGRGRGPVAQAVEILRWERMPLAVPLKVGQERIVFIDRTSRGRARGRGRTPARAERRWRGVPARQRANRAHAAAIAGRRHGALILLDIAAEPPKDGEAELEPVRIVEGTAHRRYGDQSDGAEAPARAQDQGVAAGAARNPGPGVLTRFAAQSLYAPLRTVEPLPGVMRINLRRDLDLGTLMPTLPVRARARVVAPGRPMGDRRAPDQHRRRWVTLDPRVLQGDFLDRRPSSTRRWAARHARGHDRPVPGHARPRPRAVAAAGDSPFDPAVHLPQPDGDENAEEARHAQ